MTKAEANEQLTRLRLALDALPNAIGVISLVASSTGDPWIQVAGVKWFLDGEPYTYSDTGDGWIERSRVCYGVKVFGLEHKA